MYFAIDVNYGFIDFGRYYVQAPNKKAAQRKARRVLGKCCLLGEARKITRAEYERRLPKREETHG